ncbi:alpha/beta hydrolase [Carboxylicivirga sp. N1Y90]|uniref:alpha/beta hydrolase n=1 Tax=Carboxylicivirga fragile TaxID=3417571 RepID=UPI003D34C2CF|nr:hypothetical protein [Marinilabiliaceae bacterium N1Y90]
MTKIIRNYFLLIILLAVIVPSVISAQDINVKIGIRDSIQSEILNDSKKVMIHLPDSYSESDTSYPVLYQVKGDTASMLEIVSTVNRLAYADEMIPEMIIVVMENVSGKDVWPRDSISAKSVDDFQTYIQKELIPYIGNKYRTTDERVLYGQSMTAVFTLYTFINKPKLFNSYIASSGAFPFCETFFTELSHKHFQELDKYSGRTMFVTNGLKDPLMAQVNALKQMTEFSNLVKERVGTIVSYKYLIYENEAHVPFHSLYDGLKFIYQSDEKN